MARRGRGKLRVRVDLPGVTNIVRADAPSVMPPRFRIDSEGDGERIGGPAPAFGETRTEAAVAENVHLGADDDEVVIDGLRRLSRLYGCDERRKENPRVRVRCDDEGSASGSAACGRLRVSAADDGNGCAEGVCAEASERATTALATRTPELWPTRGFFRVR